MLDKELGARVLQGRGTYSLVDQTDIQWLVASTSLSVSITISVCQLKCVLCILIIYKHFCPTIGWYLLKLKTWQVVLMFTVSPTASFQQTGPSAEEQSPENH